MANQDKPPYLFTLPTLQVGETRTHIYYNSSGVPYIITKVTIWLISDDPMYLIEGTPNQPHQANIDYLCETSDTDMFLINSTIWPLHANNTPKTLLQLLALVPTAIPLQPPLFIPTPL